MVGSERKQPYLDPVSTHWSIRLDGKNTIFLPFTRPQETEAPKLLMCLSCNAFHVSEITSCKGAAAPYELCTHRCNQQLAFSKLKELKTPQPNARLK